MKKLITLCLSLCLMAGMAVTASAADYTFSTTGATDYYFNALKNVKVGDTVTYQTNQGTRTYQVETVAHISSTDYSYLNEMGDNRITLITCIANQPSLRLCVQAVEI